MENPVGKVRAIADYQFGKGVGAKLFPDNVEIEYSRKTHRIRFIYLDGERLATLRPTDGLLSLSIKAAKFISQNLSSVKSFVVVRNDVAKFIAEGGDAFAVHVIKVDDSVRAKDEVIVEDEAGHVLAVGRAVLSGLEMMAFKTGVAVKVRHGAKSKD